MVNIYITKFEKPLTHDLWELYFKRLSPDLQERNIKFFRWQDRHSHLFGKLLLLEGAQIFNISNNILKELNYNSYQRPFLLNVDIDFNISHSGKYVLCAIGKNLRIGIDIEEIREISLDDFNKVMTPKQWTIINNSPQPYKTFYNYWTIKESVIKADGRGLSIPLDELEIENNIVFYDSKLWHISELNIDNQYSVAIATNKPCEFHLQEFDFYKKI